MPLLLRDAQAKPRLFVWEGPTDRAHLEELLDRQAWTVPQDLFEFWVATGGGEIFESETMLGPWRDSALGDNLVTFNEELQASGLPPGYVVFHTGMAISAVRLADGEYVRLDPDNFHEVERYSSLEDWYCRLLRAEYAVRYGLPAPDSVSRWPGSSARARQGRG